MFIVTHRNIFFGITASLIALSFIAMFAFGFHVSTEFTGGTLVEVRYAETRPSREALSSALTNAGIKDITLRESGTNNYTVRAPNLTEAERTALIPALSVGGEKATIERFSEIGPIIGTELRNKSFVALALVLLGIILYIAFVFRKVSEPVSSWTYGLIALVTLVHDVIVPAGFFAVLGYYFGAQIDTLFVTAMLTILGFSIHDTIVVFDRVRENLRVNQEHHRKEDFASVAGRSLGQTVTRSINTSATVVISLGALYFLGPIATQSFALTLIVGIIAGTYSSIALATPLLVAVERWKAKK